MQLQPNVPGGLVALYVGSSEKYAAVSKREKLKGNSELHLSCTRKPWMKDENTCTIRDATGLSERTSRQHT